MTEPIIAPSAHVDPSTHIGDKVSIGVGAIVASSPETPTVLMDGCSIGVGVIITAGVTVGRGARVEAGSVVSVDVPSKAVLRGNPGVIIGYVDALPRGRNDKPASSNKVELGVDGCALWPLVRITDLRGALTPIEFEGDLPFVPRRQFFVSDVANAEVRGEHAHRECDQFLIAVRGSLSVVIDDGVNSTEIRLDHPNLGLFLPAGIWGVQYKFSADGILAVYASLPYDNDDYIRSYEDFLAFRG
ncbi:MAG: WxcM-like domain-containing protein [Acidimicrobiia bacterium]|nr:WxcM-like domain-containing protein [Acidimicrobiia bacterium]